MTTASEAQADALLWAGRMVGAFAALPPDQREALLRWEATPGAKTSDWPGWGPLIGHKPFVAPPASRPIREPIPPELSLAVLERDNYRCRRCSAVEDLTIDHVHPLSQGGATELWNLQVLCRPCNARKGVRR